MIDLAGLAHEWIVTERTVALGTTPAQVMDANPRRYAFVLCLIAAENIPAPDSNFVILTIDPTNTTTGMVLHPFDVQVFDYQKLSVFVQQAWMARRAGSDAGAVLVIWEIVQTANPGK